MYSRDLIDFMITCLRADTDDQRSAAILEQFSRSDWDDFVELSIQQGVAPLLHQRLGASVLRRHIPEQVMMLLKEYYRYSAARNLLLFNDFTHIFRSLNEARIPFIVLKGAHLAETVYTERALRPMGDLDILVKESEIHRAASTLQKMGYAPSREVTDPADHHLPRLLKEGTVPVEIHRGIHHSRIPSRIDMNGLWERSRAEKINGTEVALLSHEDLILHLCLHISQHNFSVGLRCLHDIFETIRRHESGINWQEFGSRTREWGVSKAVFLALRLTGELFGETAPEPILSRIAPRSYETCLMECAKNQIFSFGSFVSDKLAEMYRSNNWWAKIRMIVDRSFHPPDQAGENPRSIGNLRELHPLRIKGLMGRYGREVWQMIYKPDKDFVLPDASKAHVLYHWLSEVDEGELNRGT